MKSTRSTVTTLAAVALAAGWLLAGPALAHHGWTNYDEKKTLTLTGAIVETSYSNPHGTIRLTVKEKEARTWEAVLAPPSRMRSRGLTPEMLTVGATVTVIGYPHREKTDELRAERITVGDKTIELR